MPSGYTIEDLIGVPALMGLMNETTTGLPDPVPDSFDKPKRQVIGNAARLFIGYGQRKVAQYGKYGSPAVTYSMENLAAKDITVLSSFGSLPIDPLTFQRLHQFDSYDMQKMGAGEVARQVGLVKQRFDNGRKVQKWSALRFAKIWADSSGNPLPSSSGAAADYTIDFGRAAGHEGQLDVFGTGAIIDAKWDTNTTNIPKHIELIQKAAAKETGLPITHAFYGASIPGFIRKNTLVQPFMPFDASMYKPLNHSTTIPDGLLGLKWVPVANAFYEDANGTLQSMFADDEIIFTPDPDKGGWWEVVEGSMLVPNSVDISAQTSSSIMANAKTVYGQYAYSQYTHNPIGLVNFFGDNCLYALKNPKATYRADVDF